MGLKLEDWVLKYLTGYFSDVVSHLTQFFLILIQAKQNPLDLIHFVSTAFS